MNEATVGKSKGSSVTFWGAAQAVTGSMHLVEAGDARVLLDCGLVLGWSSFAQERNRNFPFPPASLSAVVLSHAHIDHCGNLPNLVRQGFDGPIYCTPATRSLLSIMLADSARIQEEEAKVDKIIGRPDESTTGLLYTSREVERTLQQCVTVHYDQPRQIRAGLQVRFVDAGHLLGSAMIALAVDTPAGESNITFTGDLGRPGLKFLREPAAMPAADLIICESTYGGRTHQGVAELAAKLQDVVKATIERGGKVLIPAFSLGRAQVVIHYVRQWMAEGKLPRVPIYMDSPLAADIAEVYDLYPESMAVSGVGRGARGDNPPWPPLRKGGKDMHSTPLANGGHDSHSSSLTNGGHDSHSSSLANGGNDRHSPPLANGSMIPSPPLTKGGPGGVAEQLAPVRYIRANKESRELSHRREACVLVASGGMCEAGRILNHLENNLDDPRNCVILVSYQAPGSLGRKLMERGPMVHFRGRRWNKWADVVDVNGFSGHADQQDLVNFFRPLVGDGPRVRLVHGELEQAEALAKSLRAEGIEEVIIPRRADTVRVA